MRHTKLACGCNIKEVTAGTTHFIHLINSGCEVMDYKKGKLHHCTRQETHGEKTRKEVSVLDVGGKPQRF